MVNVVDRFPECLAFVMQFDGFKHDAALGEKFPTSYGITQYTWSDAVSNGVVTGTLVDSTEADCERILRVMFYDAMSCAKMPTGCDLMVFNDGMGAGVSHCSKLVQRIVGVAQDGRIGPQTLLAIKGMGAKAFIGAMAKADKKYFAALASAPLYIRGWYRRENEATAAALKMAITSDIKVV